MVTKFAMVAYSEFPIGKADSYQIVHFDIGEVRI